MYTLNLLPMNSKLDYNSRIKLIRRYRNGEAVTSICKTHGISRGLFYRWLKRYNSEGIISLKPRLPGRPAKTSGLMPSGSFHKLSPKARYLMVKEVVEQGTPVSDVSAKYNISRQTFYKWLRRYKNQGGSTGNILQLEDKSPSINRYYRQTPEKYEKAVLAMVAAHPEYGIRSIVRNLPKIGALPIVGHHGVQNVLRRNGLSTYRERLAYSEAQNTGLVITINKILAPVATFFKFDFDIRSRLVKYGGTVLFATFVFVVTLGLAGMFTNYVLLSVGESKIGLTFAFLALAMGSVFFLYSLKYYITLAVVLSYSEDSKKAKQKLLSAKSLFDWVLGIPSSEKSDKQSLGPVGLESDLSHVKLERKPFISVQIPFYNEKNVVERAIRAAASFKYGGEYEIILCDDSTDETTEIIRRYQKDCLFKGEKLAVKEGDGWTLTEVYINPKVKLKHLHRSTRAGYKGKALELALEQSDKRTEFVAVFDADFVPYPDTLDLFLKYFKAQNRMSEDYSKSNVAAIQGYQWHVLNKSENWITRGVRSEYAGSYVIERSGAEIYGGLKQISGSVYMIRRDVLAEIGWGTSITEDFELTLRLYDKGYKVVYTPYIQAPAECVSTVKRLVKQRMRWAEGHSFNIKKMFKRLMLNERVSLAEKLELIYLSPYYLQAFFFLVGTFAWIVSETIFKTQLPFWTEVWGWSLVLTNMIALPLLNTAGLFIEESEERDYFGIASFVALSYLLVPFQAYASVKGLLEDSEGPWFRTPKTGRITDIFSRGRFYKFIAGILPGAASQNVEPAEPSPYLSITTANNTFDDFRIVPKSSKFVGLGGSFLTVVISLFFIFQSQKVEVGNLLDYPVLTSVEVEKNSFDVMKTFTTFFMPQDVLSRGFDLPIVGGYTLRLEYAGIVTALILLILLITVLEFVGKNKKPVRKAIKVTFVYLILLSVSLGNVYPSLYLHPNCVRWPKMRV